MNPELLAVLAAHPADSPQVMDAAHALLIAGLVTAHKPASVLELGVGTGYITRVLLAAIAANQRGRLTSVDNFLDWKGEMPAHIAGLKREKPDWNLVVMDETAFLQNAKVEEYDFIVSDGDHTRGYQNAPTVFRAARRGAVLVFHDTNNDAFNLLAQLPRRCRELGFPGAHFTAQSLPGERTDRGLFVAFKNSDQAFTLDLGTRLYLRYRDLMPESLRVWLRRRAGVAGRNGS